MNTPCMIGGVGLGVYTSCGEFGARHDPTHSGGVERGGGEDLNMIAPKISDKYHIWRR